MPGGGERVGGRGWVGFGREGGGVVGGVLQKKTKGFSLQLIMHCINSLLSFGWRACREWLLLD